jgi:hypothetical protein
VPRKKLRNSNPIHSTCILRRLNMDTSVFPLSYHILWYLASDGKLKDITVQGFAWKSLKSETVKNE